MTNLTLISEKNIQHIANKSNRKNKGRKFYSWELKRFKQEIAYAFEVDVFPSTSKNSGIQSIKNEILIEVNNRNVFDFTYTPNEKDFLSIISLKDSDEYLNLYYRNGKWEEEYFLCTLKKYNHEYFLVEKGQTELQI